MAHPDHKKRDARIPVKATRDDPRQYRQSQKGLSETHRGGYEDSTGM